MVAVRRAKSSIDPSDAADAARTLASLTTKSASSSAPMTGTPANSASFIRIEVTMVAPSNSCKPPSATDASVSSSAAGSTKLSATAASKYTRRSPPPTPKAYARATVVHAGAR